MTNARSFAELDDDPNGDITVKWAKMFQTQAIESVNLTYLSDCIEFVFILAAKITI